jgi:hypothetical protein
MSPLCTRLVLFWGGGVVAVLTDALLDFQELREATLTVVVCSKSS